MRNHQRGRRCNSNRQMVNKPDLDVAHQSHYTSLGIEPIDYMKANMTPEEFRAYCQGNVIKYTSRYKGKDGIKDLKKVLVYTQWMIDSLEEACKAPPLEAWLKEQEKKADPASLPGVVFYKGETIG